MNENKTLPKQQAEEKGADVEHSTATATTTRNNMKVSDRIQAMNRIIDHELEEPLDMIAGDAKSSASGSKNYPKRSSVVEMWKKREASIKWSSTTSTASAASYKFEEKKEAHAGEEDESASGSDRDARQQDRMTLTAASSDTMPADSRLVTPERNGPESDDSNSNLGSYSSGSVRRSNVRDAWKKRAPVTATSFTPQTKSTSAHFAVITPETASSSSHNRLSAESSTNETSSSAGQGSSAVPASPSASRDGVRKTWRKMEPTKPQHTAPASPSPRPAATSYIDRSQSRDSAGSETHSNAESSTAFDELRSKWAKFGVQKVQARENSQIKPVAPPSPGAAASSLPRRAPNAPALSKKSFPEQSSPYHAKKSPAQRAEDNAPASQENPTPGGRKSQLVKMGQLHASRPNKAESSPARAKSPIKRHNAAKFSPKRNSGASSGTTMSPKRPQNIAGASYEADGSPKRNATHKSADSRIMLKAKQRRRAQLAQSSTAAAMPGMNSQRSFSSQEPTTKDSSEETFPLDEMDPDEFGKHTGAMQNMIRTSLPMRTLFGSESGESLNLGVGNSASDPSFPGPPIQMTNTDVVKTSFDSWSNFDSFQEEDLRDASLDSFIKEDPPNTTADSGSTHSKPSGSTMSSSALKRLREKRQKHFPHKVDPSYQQNTWEEPSTPRTAAETPMSASTSRNAAPSRPNYSPASPDPSSAVSASMCSETTFSNSFTQLTNGSGYTNESSLQGERKSGHLKPSFKVVVPDADKMVPDEFVSESNANVQSFQAAYENMSLEQIANDMKEEASSALSMNFLSNDLLNKSMYAAGESLNKLVAGEMFKKRQQHRLIKRAPSPVEEVAIEVEYIADDDSH